VDNLIPQIKTSRVVIIDMTLEYLLINKVKTATRINPNPQAMSTKSVLFRYFEKRKQRDM